MKIHFPLTGFNLSGGIRVILRIANGLVDRGHQVRITVPAYRSSPPFAVDPRVEVQVLGDSCTTTRLAYSGLLIGEAATWGDILVATNFKTPYLLRRSVHKNRSRAKILYLVQGYEPETQGSLFEGSLWRRWINRRVALKSYRYADERCYVSRGIAEKVGLDSSPWLVHPGVDPRTFYPGDTAKAPGPIRVGAILRAGKLKGSGVFLKALESLGDLGREVRWIFLRVGDLPFPLPPGAEVKVAKDDQEMADFYRSLDIFVMPSLYEGFGLPALEAMGCGAALMTSDVDGIREFVRNEENALVFPAGHSKALTAAMNRLILSDELRYRLASNGIKTAAHFSWRRTVDQFEAILDRLGDNS